MPAACSDRPGVAWAGGEMRPRTVAEREAAHDDARHHDEVRDRREILQPCRELDAAHVHQRQRDDRGHGHQRTLIQLQVQAAEHAREEHMVRRQHGKGLAQEQRERDGDGRQSAAVARREQHPAIDERRKRAIGFPMYTYWPPASGNIPPSSAQASPPRSVMPPATTHNNSAKRGSGTARSTSAGVRKIEAPMVPVTTNIAESNSESRRVSFGAEPGAQAADQLAYSGSSRSSTRRMADRCLSA